MKKELANFLIFSALSSSFGCWRSWFLENQVLRYNNLVLSLPPWRILLHSSLRFLLASETP